MNPTIKGIRKLVSYINLIILIGFSLFVGCSNPYEPEILPITFELDARLDKDENGYYHLELHPVNWQTTHRLSGYVYRGGGPINTIEFGWGSSHYWVIGDEFGYVIANNGLTDDMTYVGYDTTSLNWFAGNTVPIVNGSSYSRGDGEVNTVIAPVRTMRGDTATIFYSYLDNWTYEETFGEFYIIFD
jgi:hypothetical protein